MRSAEHIVDDKGATGEEARAILQRFCDSGFGGDVDKTALALGRIPQEIKDLLVGDSVPDDDLIMKVRGVAQERSIDLKES